MTWHPLPKFATWLLEHFGCGPNNHALLGDLAEQYQQSPSRLSYWWQVLYAIAASALVDARRHRWVTVRAIVAGWFAHSAATWLMGMLSVILWQYLELHYALLLAFVIFFTFANGMFTGWLVALTGSNHRRTAILGYATSHSLYSAILFVWQRIEFWNMFGERSLQDPAAVIARSLVGAGILLVFGAIGFLGMSAGAGILSRASSTSESHRLRVRD